MKYTNMIYMKYVNSYYMGEYLKLDKSENTSADSYFCLHVCNVYRQLSGCYRDWLIFHRKHSSSNKTLD